MKKLLPLLLIFAVIYPADLQAQTQTEETKVTVRALAKDAKFIGSSMGGAYVTIRDIQSGELLAEGFTEGSTGNTQKLMREPHARYGKLSTPGAAKFEASLQLDEPTFVEVSAAAPVDQKQSQVTTSTQLWLIPGKHITGDGIVLEIPGFAIDIMEPRAHETSTGESISITANAVMMCGCPTSPDGLWDSTEMEFTAVVKKDGREVARKEMSFSGQTSMFETSFEPEGQGLYRITVFGYDPRTGNTGVDKSTVISAN